MVYHANNVLIILTTIKRPTSARAARVGAIIMLTKICVSAIKHRSGVGKYVLNVSIHNIGTIIKKSVSAAQITKSMILLKFLVFLAQLINPNLMDPNVLLALFLLIGIQQLRIVSFVQTAEFIAHKKEPAFAKTQILFIII